MEGPTQITCPECNTPNSGSAPLCENCGYRLRRPGTSREGHQSLSREQVRRSLTQDGKDTEPERRAVQDLSTKDGSTILEGLAAIENTEGEEVPTVRAHEPIRMDSPSYASGLYSVPVEERKVNTFVVGILWLISIAAVALITYYLASQEQEPVALRAQSTVVEVPAGAFLRGLSEQVRAFMILTCYRVHEDKDECDEARLLKGEYPQESVELPAYTMDTHEVSFRRYNKCVEAGACTPVEFKDCRVYSTQGLQVGVRVPKSLQDDQMPAVCVTRDQARAYCSHVSGRLPSHDEWEKAARGDRGRLFPWGDSWISDAANWGEADVVQTPVLGRIDGFEWAAPSASFENGKGPYGHFDLAGNVAEWVDGSDPIKGHVRGGSWASLPFDLRTTVKLEMDVRNRRADVGFRCAY